MSKTVKNLLIVFTLLCAIVLVVFTIELFLINQGTGDSRENSPALPEETPGEIEAPPGEQPPSTTGEGSAFWQTETQQPQQPSGQPTGKRYELLYSPTKNLIVYADEVLFEHDSQMEMADMFTYIDGENASLLIRFTSLPQGAEKCAESILDGYLEENESTVGGLGPIKQSSLNGVFVSGVKDGETFEAWIHSIPDSDSNISNDIGMAFIIRYRDNEQKSALYTILDTLALIDN